ncbi:hypothetical protein ACJRO7_006069 [Eucalyptus globulus]|uniref:Major facilitator superfamily (MFS) profile domain-containing protein n=1 Tax=Eucalyptus globulus TaxID=34317 RepID=A0ABD3IK58_EUCGL
MYCSGLLGDRTNLRIFLTVGVMGTGLFTSLFGVGYWAHIHNFYYFLIVQKVAGLFQSTGWPSVVAVVGNWFGKSKRGLIMGVCNAHTSAGSLMGSLSFVVSGLIVAFMGLVVFLFLPVSPESVGADDDDLNSPKKNGEEVREPFLSPDSENKEQAVGFMEAWKIPGSRLLLFASSFPNWLHTHSSIGGKYLSGETAGDLSTVFDVGGVIGGILAGHLSDCLEARAITAASFLTSPFRRSFCTAVSTDLGTHGSLKGNSRALATVTAIIDGTGSIGAAIGPFLTGYISAESWGAVFWMLMAAALIAGLLLTRLIVAEVAAKVEESRARRSSNPTVEV